MADIFEVMRQRIKNLEAELGATSAQLKAMTTSKQELEEQLHTYNSRVTSSPPFCSAHSCWLPPVDGAESG